tara:strand:+ start:355 stop:585 length:231 start_codon:yes stop_codon:yes gene_type:complete
MDIGEKSQLFVAWHMVNTFADIFTRKKSTIGLWHEVSGEIRYEAILEQTKKEERSKETPISVLFPPFDPNADYYID